MLLDTSGFFCLTVDTEPHHALAVERYDATHRRLTHSYVLAEWVPPAQVRGVPRQKALTVAARTIDGPEVEVVWVDQALHREAVALLPARPDKTYSLCDAVSFVLMRRYGLADALTTDKHFEQEGFRRLLA